MGRRGPYRLNRRVISAIKAAISIGAHRPLAAAYASVSEASVRNWLKEGQQERESRKAGNPPEEAMSLQLSLLRAVEKAEAQAGIGWLVVVDKAAQTDPNWAWRLLKQRFPEGFSDVQQFEHSGPQGRPIEVTEIRDKLESKLNRFAECDNEGDVSEEPE